MSSSTPQKVTVVKSADGRVIVKTSENLEKESLTKVISTVTSHSTPKTVIVSSVKTVPSIVRELEEKKEKESSVPKKDEMCFPKTPMKEPKKVSFIRFINLYECMFKLFTLSTFQCVISMLL